MPDQFRGVLLYRVFDLNQIHRRASHTIVGEMPPHTFGAGAGILCIAVVASPKELLGPAGDI
jgi:hypothetical protein